MLKAAVIAAVLGMGGQLLWQTVRARPHFALNQVEVVGTETLQAAEIRDLTGVSLGVNTWDVDLQKVRQGVLRHPWVASVRVRRRLPDALVVTLREHRAMAVVSLKEARYAIDRRGAVFARIHTEPSGHLPQITGVSGTDLSEGGPRAERMLRRAAALIRILRRHYRVATVRIDREVGVTVGADDLVGVPIQFGWGDWKRKRRRLDAVLGLWSGREGQIESVSLSFDNQVVVRVRRGFRASGQAV